MSMCESVQAAQSHRSALQIGLNVVNRVLAAQPRDFVLDSTNSGESHGFGVHTCRYQCTKQLLMAVSLRYA